MKPYRPSNGTEGMIFMEHFCFECIHEKFSHTQNQADLKCEIMTNSMIYDLDESGYPKEWIRNEREEPLCTEWKHWDWGNDRDGWNEPPPPEVYDPNQLVMPFIIDEICKVKEELV